MNAADFNCSGLPMRPHPGLPHRFQDGPASVYLHLPLITGADLWIPPLTPLQPNFGEYLT